MRGGSEIATRAVELLVAGTVRGGAEVATRTVELVAKLAKDLDEDVRAWHRSEQSWPAA